MDKSHSCSRAKHNFTKRNCGANSLLNLTPSTHSLIPSLEILCQCCDGLSLHICEFKNFRCQSAVDNVLILHSLNTIQTPVLFIRINFSKFIFSFFLLFISTRFVLAKRHRIVISAGQVVRHSYEFFIEQLGIDFHSIHS